MRTVGHGVFVFGGAQAVALENAGQTEKVRATDFLTTVLRNELA
ncbi:hypothetical protein [Yoonia sp.]|nr:hypothetical protein [Yoonia sp.]